MLFTPGPTEIEPHIRNIGSQPMPYFRASEYTQMIIELSSAMQQFLGTQAGPLIITASGSGAMEMSIQNLTNPGDRVISLNGGTFGAKWGDMCRAFGLEVNEIFIEHGANPDMSEIEAALDDGATALFATAHETSTGYLYDIAQLGELTSKSDALFVVDAVSSVGADHFKMDEWKIDCAFFSSQKAMACMPGISVIAFNDKAQKVASSCSRHKYYFDAQEYAKNAVRGMIPYTPAISVTMQLMARVSEIADTGIAAYIDKHARKAELFRARVYQEAGFKPYPARQSNSMSAVSLPNGVKMSDIVKSIYSRYGWYLAPNPTKTESYLRVSHMGAIEDSDISLMAERIIEACHDCKNGD